MTEPRESPGFSRGGAVNAMLAHSRKAGKQRARKPLAKHAKEKSK